MDPIPTPKLGDTVSFPDGDRVCVQLHPHQGGSVIVSAKEIAEKDAEIARLKEKLDAAWSCANERQDRLTALSKAVNFSDDLDFLGLHGWARTAAETQRERESTKDAEIARFRSEINAKAHELTQHDVEFGLCMASFRDTNWLVLTPERETEVRALVNGGGDPRFTSAIEHVLKSVVGMRDCIRRQNETNGRLTREAKEIGVTAKDAEIAKLRSDLGLAEFKLELEQKRNQNQVSTTSSAA